MYLYLFIIDNLKTQIKNVEGMKDSLEEEDYLVTLIALHRKLSTVYTGDLQKEEEKIIKDLNDQLIAHRKLKQGLGAEEQIKARINDLEEKRKKLGKSALEDNSKAIRAKQRELSNLQIETS